MFPFTQLFFAPKNKCGGCRENGYGSKSKHIETISKITQITHHLSPS